MKNSNDQLVHPQNSIFELITLAFSRIAKPAILVTLGIGMYLHITRLFLGDALLIQYIYTATFDMIFAIPMVLGAIGVFWAWKCFAFRNRFEKIIVFITGIYFLLSIPLHIQTWYTQKTDYIQVFPIWYSFLFLVFTSVMFWVWWHLKVEQKK